MRANEFIVESTELDEGWKDWAVAGAIGLASLGAHGAQQQIAKPGDTIYSIARQHNINPVELMKLNHLNKDTKLEVGQKVLVPKTDTKPAHTAQAKPVQQAKPESKPVAHAPAVNPASTKVQPLVQVKQVDPQTAYTKLWQYAVKSGITDPTELAQFLAQCSAETGFFKNLGEIGRPAKLANKYAHSAGNEGHKDALKFVGRGFIQLTGKGNYAAAGEELHGDPEKYLRNPNLAADVDEAARIAVWFWKKNVKSRVKDFADTTAVTKAINGLAAPRQEISKRDQIFASYLPDVKTWASQRRKA